MGRRAKGPSRLGVIAPRGTPSVFSEMDNLIPELRTVLAAGLSAWLPLGRGMNMFGSKGWHQIAP